MKNKVNRQYILVVGRSFSSLRTYLREHSLDYIVLLDKKLSKHPDRMLRHRVIADFSSEESLKEALLQLPCPPFGVFATYENYIYPAAFIANHYGLPGIPLEAARACTDKQFMRDLFLRSPEPISPQFKVVESLDDALSFADEYGYPLILKPANLAKSLLVHKIETEKELKKVYDKVSHTIRDVYKKYAPHSKPKLLIEEFLEGPIHSVDAFVDEHGEPYVLEQVVDYRTGHDIGFNDNFHYSRRLPSKLTQNQKDDLRRVALLGCKALGMKSTPAHIEIIMTKKGPRIVEIGARNGGYRERMHSLANGIDITGNALALVTGGELKLEASRNDNCAVLEKFPNKAGTFTQITHEEDLLKLPSLFYFSRKTKPGDTIGLSSDGHKAVAVIILHNADSAQFERDLAFVDSKVMVCVE